jgi:signal peptidase I
MQRRPQNFLNTPLTMQTDCQGNASIEMARGLAEEVIRTFGEVRLRVFGPSMAPAMLPGDVVTIRRAGLREISSGEVVLFVQSGRLFVHRVVGHKLISTAESVEQPCLITRGDRLHHDDPPVSPQEFLGRVISLERGHRKIEIEPHESSGVFARLLRASDRATYLYLRLLASWRRLFLRGVKCRV